MKLDLKDINLQAVAAFFKNIWQDLRNRGLAPVAVTLAVALLVVPFAVAKMAGGSQAPAPGPAPVAAGVEQDAAAPGDPVTYEAGRAPGEQAAGSAENPFRQPAAKKAAEPAAATTTPADSGSAGGDSGSKTGGSGSGSDDSGKSKKSSEPSTAYQVDIRFGLAGATKSRKNVDALQPLPSPDDAYLVYLGAIDSGKTAVFLLSTDVKASGDGVCSPSETTCKQVEMRVGDTELFDVSDTDTGAALGSYELKLLKIHK